MKKLLFATLLVAAIGFTACNENKTDGPVEAANETNEQKMDDNAMPENMEDDAEFAVKAADGGMFEVRASELAQTKATMQSTKDFAAMMIKDHGMANQELMKIAGEQNIALPTAIGEDHQKKYDELAAKSGKEFDKAYCEMMKDGHASTVDMFEEEAKDGKNMALKTFASNTLPTLKMHKDKINAIVDAMK